MKVSRGEIVVVNFPYSDQTGAKRRPALVVQDDHWNQRLDDTILALVTSSPRRMTGAPTQYRIEIATPEGRQSGLRHDSIVQCENSTTRDGSLILGRLGSLPPAAMAAVDACLKAALGLT